MLAVLPEADLDACVGAGTEVVDLAGGLVMPGFQDAHVHPVSGGVERARCDLTGLGSAEEYLVAVKEYAAANPDRPWVLGGGWSIPAFGPTGPLAADLDAVVPDRPVFLPNRDHHGAWVNTFALRLAGIDETTPDPADGRIERDATRARRAGPCTRARWSWWRDRIPATTDAEYDVGAAAGSGLPALARRDGVAGRHPRCVRRQW